MFCKIFYIISIYLLNFSKAFPNYEILSKTKENLETDVTKNKQQLILAAHEAEMVADPVVSEILQENILNKLKSIYEAERQGRQFDQDIFEEEEEDETTTVSSGSSTQRAASIILPQVANIFKAIFGGNSINVTQYAQGATKFLPPSIGNQILGVVKLLAHNPASRWKPTTTTIRTTVPPRTTTPALVLIKQISSLLNAASNGTLTLNQTRSVQKTNQNENATIKIALNAIPRASSTPSPLPQLILLSKTTPAPTNIVVVNTEKHTKATTSTAKTTTEPDYEYEEEEEGFERQLKIPGIDVIGTILGGTLGTKKNVSSTTESASGFEVEQTASENGSLREVSDGLKAGFVDLVKVLPDLFKGAREAIGLISGIRGLLGSFGE